MKIAAAAALLCLATPGRAQEAFDAQARVTEALQAVRPVAMNRERVDWVAVERQARELAGPAKDTIDLLPAYHLIVWSLGDNHSLILPTDAQVDEWIRRNGRDRYLPDTPRRRASFSEYRRRPVSGRSLTLPNGRAARAVVVPAYEGDDASNVFAQSITDALGSSQACGYVVDLRGNTGGNMFPMITGLWPLLGEGFSFPGVSGPGLDDGRISVEGGRLLGYEQPGAHGEVINELTSWSQDRSVAGLPVAVLIDQVVGSSGEGVAIALKSRARTRFFGERTYGIASANTILTLSDGISMAVTVAYLKDSQGRTYPDGIPPDAPVPTGPGDRADPDDAVVEAAKVWLASTNSCAA